MKKLILIGLLLILSMVAVKVEAQIILNATYGKILIDYPNGNFEKKSILFSSPVVKGYNDNGEITYHFNEAGKSNLVVWKVSDAYAIKLVKFYNKIALSKQADNKWTIKGTDFDIQCMYDSKRNEFTNIYQLSQEQC